MDNPEKKFTPDIKKESIKKNAKVFLAELKADQSFTHIVEPDILESLIEAVNDSAELNASQQAFLIRRMLLAFGGIRGSELGEVSDQRIISHMPDEEKEDYESSLTLELAMFINTCK
jgi:hypothetical protein